MRKVCVAVVGGALAALVWFGSARAAEADVLWMFSARPEAHDDDPAEATMVGSMVSGSVCSALAEALTEWARADQSRVAIAFECRATRLEAN